MDWLKKISAAVASTALFILVVITVLGVAMRYVFDAPLHWLEEMSGFLMIWIVMIGGIATERDGQHLSVPIFIENLPHRVTWTIDLLVSLASIGILLYVAYLGYNLSLRAQFKVTEILKISWFWIDIAVPIGAVGMAFYTGCHVLRLFKSGARS